MQSDRSSVDALVAEAAAALGARDTARAGRALERALAVAPAHVGALRLLGAQQRMRGSLAEAEATLRRAAQIDPGDALVLNSLGGVLSARGDGAAAIAAFRRAVERAPQLAQAWFNLGSALSETADLDGAHQALEKAIGLAPQQFAWRRSLARVLRMQGDAAAAADQYRRVLAQAPGDAGSWYGLAGLKRIAFDAADVAAMRRAQAAAGEDDRMHLGFALARALEDQGDTAGAFAQLRDANALARRRWPWSAQALSRHVDEIRAAFESCPAPEESAGDGGAGLIFIVGMPRSGSTLIEQILASHSRVAAAGELNDLPAVLDEESRRTGQPFPDWVARTTRGDWTRLGERYRVRTAGRRGPAVHMTDKLPENWLHVGAALMMLPGARVVVSERDALETALSCYRQLFAGTQAFSYDLADIAAYHRDCERLIAHWRERWPAQIRAQSHEALLAEPEQQTRALLDFCRLPYEPGCLQFHRTARPVRTASAIQVREPLRRDTARAAIYGSVLDPLREALGLPPFAA